MAFYATWDSSVPAPSPVTGWYDTNAYSYPNLPSNRILLEESFWLARMTTLWAVENGNLIPYVPPLPPHDIRSHSKQLLHDSHDMVMVHIEAGNPVPQAILDYRNILRRQVSHPEPVYEAPPRIPT